MRRKETWPKWKKNKKNKTPQKELNKMEITNLSDAEFKTLVIGMLKELSEDVNSVKKKI